MTELTHANESRRVDEAVKSRRSINPLRGWLTFGLWMVVFFAVVPGILFLVAAALFMIPAPEPKLERSADWLPVAVGGPLEVKPLPPTSQVESHWASWQPSGTNRLAKLYRTQLNVASLQSDYRADISRHDTPLGRPWFTVVRFEYAESIGWRYRFRWQRRGKHDPDILRVSAQGPMEVLVSVLDVDPDDGIPVLQIRAIEGFESGTMVALERLN